jgi:hypothetical protein
MAESFTNALSRSVGFVTTTNNVAIVGVKTDTIVGVSTVGVDVGDLVINQHFRGGAKVTSIGGTTVVVDKTSTNTAQASSQTVSFLGPTTSYTASQKAILIGGTFSNLTNNSVNIYVEVSSGSTATNLANDVPVPSGSSFVISDAGKTVMLLNDELKVYCDAESALDVTLGILEGVN